MPKSRVGASESDAMFIAYSYLGYISGFSAPLILRFIHLYSHRCSGEIERACYTLFDIRNTGNYTYISEVAVNGSWTKLACTEDLVCDYIDDEMNNVSIQVRCKFRVLSSRLNHYSS